MPIATTLEKVAPAKPADARTFAIEIARLAAATRCHSVVVLDVRDVSTLTDYLVLATGTSERQMKGVGNEVEELGQTINQHVMSRSADPNWILLDFVDVVIHLFEQESRMYYDLDSMFGDAPRVEWREEKSK